MRNRQPWKYAGLSPIPPRGFICGSTRIKINYQPLEIPLPCLTQILTFFMGCLFPVHKSVRCPWSLFSHRSASKGNCLVRRLTAHSAIGAPKERKRFRKTKSTTCCHNTSHQTNTFSCAHFENRKTISPAPAETYNRSRNQQIPDQQQNVMKMSSYLSTLQK